MEVSMTAPDVGFGTDLRLLPSLDAVHSNRDAGNDLQTTARPTGGRDLAALTGADNLRQALVLRLLTPIGALADLGHPDYGSRVHELIGERNTSSTRNRAKMAALQSIEADPRVAGVRSIDARTAVSDPTEVEIVATVDTVAGGAPVTLVVPLPLRQGVLP
jgi:phage baseplate assembly protein W